MNKDKAISNTKLKVHTTIKNKIFTGNGWDTVANMMQKVIGKFTRNPVTHFQVTSTNKYFNLKIGITNSKSTPIQKVRKL